MVHQEILGKAIKDFKAVTIAKVNHDKSVGLQLSPGEVRRYLSTTSLDVGRRGQLKCYGSGLVHTPEIVLCPTISLRCRFTLNITDTVGEGATFFRVDCKDCSSYLF